MSDRPPSEAAPAVRAGSRPRAAQGGLWLRSPWPILLALCVAAAAWVYAFGNPLEIAERRWMGQLLRWRYEKGWAPPVDPHIVHVDVTLADLQEMPSLEAEYAKMAQIIRMATGLGARVVAFDAIFGRGTEAMNAGILAEVERAQGEGRSVIFAEALFPAADGGAPVRMRSFPRRERSRLAGLINVRADADGVLRQYEMALRVSEKLEPSLALASYLAWRDVPWEGGVTFPAPDVVRWEELSEDFTSSTPHTLKIEPLLVNMRAPWAGSGPATFRHFTVKQLEDEHRRSEGAAARPLENAIVFVSYTSTGLGDVGTTALAATQPRVILHSSALNDLIQSRPLRRTSREHDLLAVAAVLVLGALAVLCRRTVPLIALWLVALGGFAAGSAWLVMKQGWVPAAVLAAVLWTVWIVAEVARRYSNELLQRIRIRATMSLYFSPRVMERVLKNPGCMEPHEAEVTVLLTDLRNSTPMAEVAGARGTFTMLNQVFEAQTEAVMAEDGTMEHFLGDQFLCYWGAPDPQADAADRACRAAQKLIVSMRGVKERLSPELGALFGYGVALHSGKALLGNKGSARRLDYGLVGDLINAAARIEALTKLYGVLFLVSRETFDKLQQPPPSRPLDVVIVKGKSTPMQLLELKHAFSPPNFEAVAAEYTEAFAIYQRGEFAAAQNRFARLAEHNDRPSKVMVERCQELLETPPVDWRGVYEMKSK